MSAALANDVLPYDIYEIDLFRVKDKIECAGISSVIVYGIGNNGDAVHELLENIKISIKYYVDVKANEKTIQFRKTDVISPSKLKETYAGEYIVVTPAIHDRIIEWLLSINVPKDHIISEFYFTERISIDYRRELTTPSKDILYCPVEPESPKATFITIAYNTPGGLFRRAIESVLRQSCKDFVYTIIINGATDDTPLIAAEYANLDKRINLVHLPVNLAWTNPHLLSTVQNNIFGKYCCQLDADDYYDEVFLEKTLSIAEENNADIVCVRTCLFSADSKYDPLQDGLLYDWHDKYYFNVVHPRCHLIGHQNIMKAYAKSEICSTFWGKLYDSRLMNCYLEYLLGLDAADRELYYRLDIAMTYKILSMAKRVFYSDKVLHYYEYSQKNSTFSLSPIEWLMSLWYAYRYIKGDMYTVYKKWWARKYSKMFLQVHLMWMVSRKGMLDNVATSPYKEQIIQNLEEMYHDTIFTHILLRKKGYMATECKAFYDKIGELIHEEAGR